jgi:hypothetical protein
VGHSVPEQYPQHHYYNHLYILFNYKKVNETDRTLLKR